MKSLLVQLHFYMLPKRVQRQGQARLLGWGGGTHSYSTSMKRGLWWCTLAVLRLPLQSRSETEEDLSPGMVPLLRKIIASCSGLDGAPAIEMGPSFRFPTHLSDLCVPCLPPYQCFCCLIVAASLLQLHWVGLSSTQSCDFDGLASVSGLRQP